MYQLLFSCLEHHDNTLCFRGDTVHSDRENMVAGAWVWPWSQEAEWSHLIFTWETSHLRNKKWGQTIKHQSPSQWRTSFHKALPLNVSLMVPVKRKQVFRLYSLSWSISLCLQHFTLSSLIDSATTIDLASLMSQSLFVSPNQINNPLIHSNLTSFVLLVNSSYT